MGPNLPKFSISQFWREMEDMCEAKSAKIFRQRFAVNDIGADPRGGGAVAAEGDGVGKMYEPNSA